jgi:hypothetical protein
VAGSFQFPLPQRTHAEPCIDRHFLARLMLSPLPGVRLQRRTVVFEFDDIFDLFHQDDEHAVQLGLQALFVRLEV